MGGHTHLPPPPPPPAQALPGGGWAVQAGAAVCSRNKRTYWVAKITRNLAELHTLALNHGGAHHLLTRALETPLFAR